MSSRDQVETETVMVQMAMRGIGDVDVIAFNIFLDLEEDTRQWWMGTQPGPGGHGLLSYEHVYGIINEAAQREQWSPGS